MDTLEVKILGSTVTFPNIQYLPPSSSSQSSPPISAAPHHASPFSASAPPPPPRVPEHLPYKNRLQAFTQRSNIALPMYQTVNEGPQHAPKFRSTVWVDGMSFTSLTTFSQQKAAEQDVARVALEGLTVKFRDEGRPLICENTFFSKAILNEYATKLNVERPTYNTIQLEGPLPLFVSSLVFKGTKYTGDAARSKKDAEQLAARAAIVSILGDSSSGTLYEIIKSKCRIYAAVKPNKSRSIDASSAMANTGHTFVSLDHKDKEVAVLVAASNNQTKITLPVPSTVPSLYPEFQMPKHIPSLETTVTKLPNMNLLPGSEQAIGDGSGSKKRRKNKKKANKKARLESLLPIEAFSLNKSPPCSVAQ